MTTLTLTPKPHSGAVSIRLAPSLTAARLGQLDEGAHLELDATGAEWHSARVYVMKSVADRVENTIGPQAAWATINIRSAPRAEAATDVGDLTQGQRLELIEDTAEWYITRVYLSAQFTDTPASDRPVTPDDPRLPRRSPLTAAELQALSLMPAQARSAAAGSTQAAFSAARIWNKYGGLLDPLCGKLGIDVAAAVAVIAVESGGSGFAVDGRLIIRFENHLFWFNWGQANAPTYQEFFQFDSAVTWRGHRFRSTPGGPWQEVHANQASEWAALTQARALNDPAAKKSISMGLVQILGSNHRAIGYDSVDAMFDAFGADERYQLLGFFNFINNDQRQIAALRAGDFVAFARIYNGPGQPQFYGDLIKGVFDGFKTLHSV